MFKQNVKYWNTTLLNRKTSTLEIPGPQPKAANSDCTYEQHYACAEVDLQSVATPELPAVGLNSLVLGTL